MSFDVDVDTPSGFDPMSVFHCAVRASIYRDKKIVPHPCGVYFQDVPKDPVTGLAAAPYDIAESLGCFKVDFLHLPVYDHFSSNDEVREMASHEPDWSLLLIPSVVEKLFQISKHYDLVCQVRPTSVIEMADCLALIRPQKRHLLGRYLRDRSGTRAELYRRDSGSGYAFKKAHSVAYSLVIVLQLHLIKAGTDI